MGSAKFANAHWKKKHRTCTVLSGNFGFGKERIKYRSKYIIFFSLVNIPVPNYWDPQPKGADGKEIPLHIVRLDATKHSKEYKKVGDGFLQTANNHTILKIERIQNPSLFKQYAAKKQSMEEQNGSKERFLYHGTAADVVPNINQNGLNRSYSGKNGENLHFSNHY